MKAINTKNQAVLNRAINWLEKHNEAASKRDIIEGEHGEDSKEWATINRACEKTFNKFEELLNELPKNQQKIILNSDLY